MGGGVPAHISPDRIFDLPQSMLFFGICPRAEPCLPRQHSLFEFFATISVVT
jgi:hypothetical protein